MLFLDVFTQNCAVSESVHADLCFFLTCSCRVVLVFLLDLAESCFHVIVVLALHAGWVTAMAEIENQ